MKTHKEPTLADSICDLRTRKIKTIFNSQLEVHMLLVCMLNVFS